MSWMATRLSIQFGREFTAQPYGINTVGAFPFLFGIMLPIAIQTGSLEMAWKAGVTGNFIVGLINVLLGCIFAIPACANFILNWVPVTAFTVPVAGVGLTWLALNQIAPCFSYPMGMLGVFMVVLMYMSKAPLKIGKFKLPEVLHWVVPGMIVGYAYLTCPASQPGYTFVYPGGGLWIGGAFLEGFSMIGGALGTVIPIAIAASAGDLMALVGAYNAGDPFPIPETLIVDGLMTILGSILGSPFGTVIYFGHPVHKRLGGKCSYSAWNGVIYLILCLSGIFPLFLDIFPKQAVGPTIMIFGLLLAEDCTKFSPQRHHGVIFFALWFGFCEYFNTGFGISDATDEGRGIVVMAKGALLSCMIWSSMYVYAIDRRYLPAAAFAVFAAFFSFLGIIHNDGINFDNLVTGSLKFADGTPVYACSPLQFMLAYLLLALFLVIWAVLQRVLPNDMPQPIYQTDETASEMDKEAMAEKRITIGSLDNWWAKAPATDPKVVATETTKA